MRRPLHAGVALSSLLFLVLASMTPSCAESADSDAAEPCDDGLTTCGGDCVDLRTDRQHCGDCSNDCAEGRACEAGQCVASCPAGSTRCGSSCADLLVDPLNCGGCNVGCLDGTHCEEGVCKGGCDEGQTLCGGACVDMQSDEANCGACGSACPADRICSGAKCVLDCPGETVECSAQCVDTQTNTFHCGGCGLACASGFTCEAGVCKNPSVEGSSSVCDGTGDCATCQSCAFNGACQTQLEACMNEPECVDLNLCYEPCGADQACIDACYLMYPAGAALYDSLGECVLCDACLLDCDGASAGCP